MYLLPVQMCLISRNSSARAKQRIRVTLTTASK